MEIRILSDGVIERFRAYLKEEEKSSATVEKYLRDVQAFRQYTRGKPVSKEQVLAYKIQLQEKKYAIRSINSMLASLNSLFDYLGWEDCKARSLRVQQQIYCPEEKELSKAEYMRLLQAAKRNEKLNLVMQTICGTGIRVSELRHFTVEAVSHGEIQVRCKGKSRYILLPEKLKKLLLSYADRERIRSGMIFRNSRGGPLSRGSIWGQMKQLCRLADVDSAKVFPHNLRKLFARTFYRYSRTQQHQHDQDLYCQYRTGASKKN